MSLKAGQKFFVVVEELKKRHGVTIDEIALQMGVTRTHIYRFRRFEKFGKIQIERMLLLREKWGVNDLYFNDPKEAMFLPGFNGEEKPTEAEMLQKLYEKLLENDALSIENAKLVTKLKADYFAEKKKNKVLRKENEALKAELKKLTPT